MLDTPDRDLRLDRRFGGTEHHVRHGILQIRRALRTARLDLPFCYRRDGNRNVLDPLLDLARGNDDRLDLRTLRASPCHAAAATQTQPMNGTRFFMLIRPTLLLSNSIRPACGTCAARVVATPGQRGARLLVILDIYSNI